MLLPGIKEVADADPTILKRQFKRHSDVEAFRFYSFFCCHVSENVCFPDASR